MSETVNRVIKLLPTDDKLCDLSDFFRIFGDTTRIKILFALMDNELNVTDISEIINMSQSATSHQLKVLKNYELIKNRRDGKAILYSLADDHVNTIINVGFEHINEI